MTDGELLHRYAAAGDGEAFTELVRRHGGMVHAAARRLAGDGDADDVAQAVFLLLAQRAAKLARHRNVAGWLYNVTRYCASNARRTRGRREKHLERYQQQQQHQREAGMTDDVAAHEADRAVAADMLDAGLAKLKDDQRQAVLLRYIEGLSLDQAAERLGINAPAVAKRAERGIARLREYFQARGVTFSDAALAATPISAAMLASLSQIGTAGVSAGGAAMTLASSTAKSMAVLAALKVAAAVVIVAAAATAATVAINPPLRSPRPAGAAAAAAPPAPSASAPATAPAPTTRPPLTRDGATVLADTFLRAIRERDEATLANLSAAPTPAARQDFAAGVVAEALDRAYARFPQRLDRVVNNSMTVDMNQRALGIVFETPTPTNAQVRRLRIELTPVDDTWRIATARMSQVGVTQGEQLRDKPATTLPAGRIVPLGTYARASAIFQQLQSRLFYEADTLVDADAPRVIESMTLAEADVRRLADELRSTDLVLDDTTVRLILKYLNEARDAVKKNGVTAMKEKEKAVEADPAMMAAGERLFGLGSTLSARADAEAEAQLPGPRPPAFAPPIEATQAWDGKKVALPGPVILPPWFRASQTFKTWQKRHNIETFRTRDDAGNAYEIYCMGGVIEEGKTYDVIPSVRQYRADGTLAAASEWDHFGQPTGWSTYDATGERYTIRVITTSRGDERQGPREVAAVSFFDAGENEREWHMQPGNVAWLELLNDPIGKPIRTLNQAPRPVRKGATMRSPTTRSATPRS